MVRVSRRVGGAADLLVCPRLPTAGRTSPSPESHLFDVGRGKHIEVKAVLTDRGVGVPRLRSAEVPKELVPGLHTGIGKALGF